MNKTFSFVFFGSSPISEFVLDELAKQGLRPLLRVKSAREPLPMEKLHKLRADVFVVASFGKILPSDLINTPPHKTLNMHPSLLPKLRGPSPIQETIIRNETPGVTIMRIDEAMDHGPILAQEEVPISPWPDVYSIVEEKLGRAGGVLLARVLPQWINGSLKEVEQDHHNATYTKLIKKDESDITNDSPEIAYRKVLAYEVWPRARLGNLIVTKAHLTSGELVLDRVIPPGRKEMSYQDYQRGKH